MLPGLIRQEGYDYNAIRVVWDAKEIEAGRRGAMLETITKLIDVIDVERKSRRQNAR